MSSTPTEHVEGPPRPPAAPTDQCPSGEAAPERRARPGGRGKYGHGLPLAPSAEALAEALLRLSGLDALHVLLSLHRRGCSLDEIELQTLEPALLKVGELWLRGRVDDERFRRLAVLAEHVERQFRLGISTPTSAR